MSHNILIVGFPHCGTTILRSILGHIPNVHVEIQEGWDMSSNPGPHFCVRKVPAAFPKFFTEEPYTHWTRIFLLRDPRYVFTSILKRFGHARENGHTPKQFDDAVKLFLAVRKNAHVYCIRYQDMFSQNYTALRTMFGAIGLACSDDIFDQGNFYNRSHVHLTDIPETKPQDDDHERYRMWQINQPFQNMNGGIALTETVVCELAKYNTWLQLF